MSSLFYSGLSFVGIFNIPQDNGCNGDALCLWLGETVGRDATIEISGTITKTSFAFGAKFAGSIPLYKDKLNLQSIELKVAFNGLASSVSLSCTLYWSSKEVLGTGQLQFMGKQYGLKIHFSFTLIEILLIRHDYCHSENSVLITIIIFSSSLEGSVGRLLIVKRGD